MGCSLSSQKHATDSSHGVPQISPEKSDSSKRRLKLGLGYEDPALLAQETAFTENEVESLYDLFKKLSSSLIDDGCIHKEEFQLALFRTRGRENFFANRVFDIFDINKNGVIGFGEFVRSLSVFHPNAPIDDKIDFSFRFYDLRGTGSIEREEVKEMLLTVFEESEMQLTDDVIESILDETFSNGIQKIAREEWKDHVKKSPMLMQHMTLPYLQDISTEFPSFSF